MAGEGPARLPPFPPLPLTVVPAQRAATQDGPAPPLAPVPAPAPVPTGLVAWQPAALVICMPCKTAIYDGTKLKHHLATSPHKAAVAQALQETPRPAALSSATSSVNDCKAMLAAGPQTPAQKALSERYLNSPWPASSAVPHLAPLPGLPTYDGYVCYNCKSGNTDLRQLQKQHTVHGDGAPPLDDDPFEEKCAKGIYTLATLQSLQRGNRTRLYPVQEVSNTPPAAAAPGALPMAATMPLDVFLGGGPPPVDTGGGTGGSAAAAGPSYVLPTSEDATDASAGGLMQMYRFDASLAALHWTAASTMEHFGLFAALKTTAPPPGAPADSYEPRGSFFFASLKAAVLAVCDGALSFVRDRGPTVASRLRIGKATADTVSHRPFNVRITPPTVSKYARDTAILLYVSVELAALGARTDTEVLEDGRQTPALSAATSALAAKVRRAFRAKAPRVIQVVRDKRAAQPDYAAGQDDASLVGQAVLADAVSALLRGIFHEVFDPRPLAVGGSGKTQSDVALLMPFLSVLYPSATAAALTTVGGDPTADTAALHVSYMDAGSAQHLAGALIFSTHIANTLHLMKEKVATATESYAQIADLSNPTADTAAAYIVQLYAHGESIGRSEHLAPAFLPCEDPEHLVDAVPGAICGSLLTRGVHLSTVTLGERVVAAQARMYDKVRELLFGYDPEQSSFFTDALSLVDVPTRQEPGVSFLQLKENRETVRRLQSHLLTSGALDSAACPVRPAHKRASGPRRPGEPARMELDLSAPPVAVKGKARVDAWLKQVELLRADLWAIMHVVGGAPARQTESAAISICASIARIRRSLFIHDGQVYIVLFYHKGQVQGQGVGRPIARFLDAKTSALVLLILTLLDPLEAYIARAVAPTAGAGAAPMDRSLLFRDSRGGQLSARHLSTALESRLLGGVTRLPMGVRVYRQVSAAMAKAVTKADLLAVAYGTPQAEEADRGSVMELQSGHSSRTAAGSYAGDPSLTFASLTNLAFFKFRQVSLLWHASMGLASTHVGGSLRRPLEPAQVAINAIKSVGRGGDRPSGGATTTAAGPAAGASDAGAPPPLSLPLAVQLGRPRRIPTVSALKMVDELVSKRFGSYKSAEQEAGTHHILLARDPQTILLVLPTGGGKSACILLPVACEAECARTLLLPGPAVTFVLSPTRAVSATIKEAAKALGLVVVMWRRGGCACPESASLVIVDISTAVQDMADLLLFVSHLDGQGRLARFVVDEAHLVNLWSAFRYHLLHLRTLLADLPCPLVLLTATAPVAWVRSLVNSVTLSPSRPLSVIRPASTRRPNIQYRVEPCPEPYQAAPIPDANARLHAAMAARINVQVAAIRNPSGDRQGRSAIIGCFCETVKEVTGVADALCAALGASDSDGAADDVVVLMFHSTGNSIASRQGAHNNNGVSGVGTTSTGGEAAAAAPGTSGAPPVGSSGDTPNPDFIVHQLFGRGQRLGGQGVGGVGGGTPLSSSSGQVSAAALVEEVSHRPGVGVTVVVGSPAVSTGTDFPRMVWALFLSSRNLMSFAQTSGRLCRNPTLVGTAVVWVPEHYSRVLTDVDQAERIPQLEALGDFVKWACLPPTCCRRLGLDTVLDGTHPDDFLSCVAGNFAKCDYCSPTGTAKRGRGGQGNDGGGDGGGGKRHQANNGQQPPPQLGPPPSEGPSPGGAGGTGSRGIRQFLNSAPRPLGRAPLAAAEPDAEGPRTPSRPATSTMSDDGAGEDDGDVLESLVNLYPMSFVTPPRQGRRSAAADSEFEQALLDTPIPTSRQPTRVDHPAGSPVGGTRLPVVQAALERGMRAAAAVVQSVHQGGDTRPCAWCRALSVSQFPESHGYGSCFPSFCMHCVRPSIKPGSLNVDTVHAVCVKTYANCKKDRTPWDRSGLGSPSAKGTICSGCRLSRTIRPDQHLSLDSHARDGFGATKCAWTFCIKVVLIQVHLARSEMSTTNDTFDEALFNACKVAYTLEPQGADLATDTPSVAERVIPARLVDWGSESSPPSVDLVASWLTDGGTLPNIVLFAPVLARAFGLTF